MNNELTNVLLNTIQIGLITFFGGLMSWGLKIIIGWTKKHDRAMFGDGSKENPGVLTTLAVHGEKLDQHEDRLNDLFDRTDSGFTKGPWDGRNRRNRGSDD
jgi:hypothetical protein